MARPMLPAALRQRVTGLKEPAATASAVAGDRATAFDAERA
jgi:hypothetical protein